MINFQLHYMKYKGETQKAREKFLQQKQLSQKEMEIIEKDFRGRDYSYYESMQGKDSAYYESMNDNEIFLPERYSADATYHRISKSIQPGISRLSFIKYAAAVVLLISVTFGVYLFNKPVENVIVSTSYGERKQVDLPDGSVVILNSLSSVTYPENINKGRTRKIELHGEAYFDVAKDTQRTFIVKASEIEIKVLGTKFNISAYENDENIITDLYEGAVSVSPAGGNSLQLKPGEQAVYNRKADHLGVTAINDKNKSEWINGSIYFENIPLKNIFKILEREKNITFHILDGVDKELKLTAKFSNNESVDEILEQLSLPGRFTFEKKENIYIINKQKH